MVNMREKQEATFWNKGIAEGKIRIRNEVERTDWRHRLRAYCPCMWPASISSQWRPTNPNTAVFSTTCDYGSVCVQPQLTFVSLPASFQCHNRRMTTDCVARAVWKQHLTQSDITTNAVVSYNGWPSHTPVRFHYAPSRRFYWTLWYYYFYSFLL